MKQNLKNQNKNLNTTYPQKVDKKWITQKKSINKKGQSFD